jgi:hypothetical protein
MECKCLVKKSAKYMCYTGLQVIFEILIEVAAIIRIWRMIKWTSSSVTQAVFKIIWQVI